MKVNNIELKQQGNIIEELYEYDERINAFIEKSTNRIVSIERQTYMKKLLLLGWAVVLGFILLIVIYKKIF